jgi:hypothetical protein
MVWTSAQLDAIRVRRGRPGNRRCELHCQGEVLGGAIGIAALLTKLGSLGIGFAELRVETNRFVEVSERLIELTLSGMRRAAVDMCQSIDRIKMNGGVAVCDCLCPPLLAAQAERAVAMTGGTEQAIQITSTIVRQ